MKIKYNPNIKNEMKDQMQHILEVYILCTCHENTRVCPSAPQPPPLVCFHPNIGKIYFMDGKRFIKHLHFLDFKYDNC